MLTHCIKCNNKLDTVELLVGRCAVCANEFTPFKLSDLLIAHSAILEEQWRRIDALISAADPTEIPKLPPGDYPAVAVLNGSLECQNFSRGSYRSNVPDIYMPDLMQELVDFGDRKIIGDKAMLIHLKCLRRGKVELAKKIKQKYGKLFPRLSDRMMAFGLSHQYQKARNGLPVSRRPSHGSGAQEETL